MNRLATSAVLLRHWTGYHQRRCCCSYPLRSRMWSRVNCSHRRSGSRGCYMQDRPQPLLPSCVHVRVPCILPLPCPHLLRQR